MNDEEYVRQRRALAASVGGDPDLCMPVEPKPTAAAPKASSDWIPSDGAWTAIFTVLGLGLLALLIFAPWVLGLIILAMIVPWVPRILLACLLGLLNLFRVM